MPIWCLPATTAFEQASYCYYGNAIRYREQMIEPVGLSKPRYQILVELADRLGYGDQIPRHPDVLLADILAKSDTSAFRADDRRQERPLLWRQDPPGLSKMGAGAACAPTASRVSRHRRVSLKSKSTILEQYGLQRPAGLRGVRRNAGEQPGSFHKRFPLILGTGPFKPDMKSLPARHSQLHQKVSRPHGTDESGRCRETKRSRPAIWW